ncbi:hypothetical protein ACFLZW_01965 [Chloroflexota bacterium]
MIIHQPEIIIQENHTIAWAKIELDKPRQGFPEYLWFRVPNRFANYLSQQIDAFLLPALQAAMHFGEDLQVRGAVSPQLAYNLEEYQFVQSFHFPKELRQVSVVYERLEPLKADPKAVGVAFSAGVDSFYALFKHLPQNQPIPGYQVTHALFINGFDLTQPDRGKYQHLLTHYQKLLADLNIELVPLETNLTGTVVPWLEYRLFYAPALLGCIHILANRFGRFIVSNSRDYTQPQVNSTPLADRLLSTETLDLIHFGATVQREEKIREISGWPPAQQNLRVCGIPNVEAQNCSRCEKCLRSMLPIYALGKMRDFQTFTEPLKNDRSGLRLAPVFDPYSDHTPTNTAFFKRHKPGLLPWLRAAALLGGIRFWLMRCLRFLLVRFTPQFIKDRLKQSRYYLTKFRHPYAFDNPDIIQRLSHPRRYGYKE